MTSPWGCAADRSRRMHAPPRASRTVKRQSAAGRARRSGGWGRRAWCRCRSDTAPVDTPRCDAPSRSGAVPHDPAYSRRGWRRHRDRGGSRCRWSDGPGVRIRPAVSGAVGGGILD